MRKKPFLYHLTVQAEKVFSCPRRIVAHQLENAIQADKSDYAFLLVINSEKGGVIYNRLNDVEGNFKRMAFELQKRGIAHQVSTYMLDLNGENLGSVVKGYDDEFIDFGRPRLVIIDKDMNFKHAVDIKDCPACLFYYDRGNEKMFQLVPPPTNMMMGMLKACGIELPSLNELHRKYQGRISI